jgi:hypothetical protein
MFIRRSILSKGAYFCKGWLIFRKNNSEVKENKHIIFSKDMINSNRSSEQKKVNKATKSISDKKTRKYTSIAEIKIKRLIFHSNCIEKEQP